MSDERESLDAELEREIEAALGDTSLLGVDKSRPAPSVTPLDAPLLAPDADPEAGAFADATVSGVGTEDVFVEFGPRAQGVISADQFSAPPDVGEVVRVYVERFDAKEGLWLCALKKSLQAAAGWGSVEPGAVVMATARAVNKGGLDVQVGHLTGFLPASHVSLHRVEDLETVVGETFAVEVIEADPDKRRLVVSRRAVLARERDRHTDAALERLQPGDVVSGQVTRVEKYGAFVDLGGVEGLLHVSQMAWKRVENPEDVVKVGDQVKVTVLEVKEEDRRISLGMKQLQEDPWMRFTVDHPAGSVMEGTVTRLMHFGAFIEVADGIEGLAHVSQLAPHQVGSPREVVRPGDKVSVRIVNVEPERRRIGLSFLTERGDRLTDDVADDATIRDHLGRAADDEPEPTLGDLLKKAMQRGGGGE
jgi:small subunit ribosomal protein S1